MTGKTHRIAGIVAGTGYFLSATSIGYQPATFAAVLIVAYFGSLIPDIDQPQADIWDSLPFGHTVGKVTDPFLKHRNISHSIFGFIIFATILYYILKLFPNYWAVNTNIVFVSGLISFASHLFLDMITNEGIPLLYPWKKMFGIPPKPFQGFRIAGGQWFENLVIFPVLNIVLIIVLIANWNHIKNILFK